MSEQKTNPYLVPISILIAGGVIALGIFFSGREGTSSIADQNGQENDPTSPGQEQRVSQIREIDERADFIRGNKDAEIFIVEYSDFECPFCQRFHNTMLEVVNAYPNDVAWVYRHFPLTQIHPQAQPSAVASECIFQEAGTDAFWEFADEIFAKQSSMNADLYLSIATRLGISEADFTSCINDANTLKKVEEDALEALSAGARGTPFSLVVDKDGEVLSNVEGALPFSAVKPTIDRILESI